MTSQITGNSTIDYRARSDWHQRKQLDSHNKAPVMRKVSSYHGVFGLTSAHELRDIVRKWSEKGWLSFRVFVYFTLIQVSESDRIILIEIRLVEWGNPFC